VRASRPPAKRFDEAMCRQGHALRVGRKNALARLLVRQIRVGYPASLARYQVAFSSPSRLRWPWVWSLCRLADEQIELGDGFADLGPKRIVPAAHGFALGDRAFHSRKRTFGAVQCRRQAPVIHIIRLRKVPQGRKH